MVAVLVGESCEMGNAIGRMCRMGRGYNMISLGEENLMKGGENYFLGVNQPGP